VFYYDASFMLRRMDYSPDVTGKLPIAHYTHNPQSFAGFVFPTRRRIHRRDADDVADQRVAAITLDIEIVIVNDY
jgi:predicted nucleic acid-binding protein